ncbi:hypothetical protein MUK42_04277 [Musa troglodytarum]|uniref:Uncharacterized protein n=1 Tax=Musa troglodytarum TaxID=320322 RepID=A0A9E7G1F0_9LILI|nr:hypothetical protein MUK42_04277 [Musa troglodytarum]
MHPSRRKLDKGFIIALSLPSQGKHKKLMARAASDMKLVGVVTRRAVELQWQCALCPNLLWLGLMVEEALIFQQIPYDTVKRQDCKRIYISAEALFLLLESNKGTNRVYF